MKNERLPKTVLLGQPSRTKEKAGRSRMGWVGVVKKYLRKMGSSWKGVKREALNGLGWRSVRSCVGIRRLAAAVGY